MKHHSFFAIVLCSTLLLAACTSQQQSSNTAASRSPAMGDGIVQQKSMPLPYEFVGITTWYNLPDAKTSLKREDLLGKVVLVDFWTYSCINCIRTVPYIEHFSETYAKDGLVVVGVHTPEFSFEHEPTNVAHAITEHNISYIVGLDNEYATWMNFQNSYWPHVYVFDRDGKLVFDHIGEGGYDEIEVKIQELLAKQAPIADTPTVDFSRIGSPEIYLGGAKTRGNTAYALDPGRHSFSLPTLAEAKPNTVYLGGNWTIENEDILANEGATLLLMYHARNIHVVAGGTGSIAVSIDGQNSTIPINGHDLYTLASTAYDDHTVLLTPNVGVSLFSFTFG